MSQISKRYYQKWSDLTPEQQKKSGSKEEHSAKREELGIKGVNVELDTRPRMAGDAIVQMNRSGEPNKDAIAAAKEVVYGKGLEGFDPTAAGSGALSNQNKLSAADIRGLHDAGVTGQELLDYIEANPEINVGGDKAQNVLRKYTANLTSGGEDTQPSGGGEDTQPSGGGEDTQPGGGGEDTQPGGGSGVDYSDLEEDAFKGDSPEATANFLDFFKDQNRKSTEFWNAEAAKIPGANWAIFGKDNDFEYEKDMIGVNESIIGAHANATYHSGLLYGDIERYPTVPFVMNWDQEPVDTDLEDDDIDFG